MAIRRTLANIISWYRDSKWPADMVERVYREEKVIKPIKPEYVASLEQRLNFIGTLLNRSGGRIGGAVSLALNIRALEAKRAAQSPDDASSDIFARYGLPEGTAFLNGFYRQHDSLIINVFENNLKGLVELFAENGFGFYSRKANVRLPPRQIRLSYDKVTAADALIINEDGSYKHRNLAFLHQQSAKPGEEEELIHKIEVYVHHAIFRDPQGTDHLLVRDYSGSSPSGFVMQDTRSANCPVTQAPMEAMDIKIIGHEKDRQVIPLQYYIGEDVKIGETVLRTIHPYVRLLTFHNMEFPPTFKRVREIRAGEARYMSKVEWPTKSQRTLDITSMMDLKVIEALSSIMQFDPKIYPGKPIL